MISHTSGSVKGGAVSSALDVLGIAVEVKQALRTHRGPRGLFVCRLTEAFTVGLPRIGGPFVAPAESTSLLRMAVA